jgi:hypothetical protein
MRPGPVPKPKAIKELAGNPGWQPVHVDHLPPLNMYPVTGRTHKRLDSTLLAVHFAVVHQATTPNPT